MGSIGIANRRKSGVDDTIHVCKGCGKEFLTNKYNPRKYCEECKENRCQKKVGKNKKQLKIVLAIL